MTERPTSSDFSLPLPKVNTQAGKIRLWFFVLLFLALWSLLATFLAYADPNFRIPTILLLSEGRGVGPQSNLLNYYLSAFAILNVLIILASFTLGFVQARRCIAEAMLLTHSRSIGKFLRNCAFSIAEPDDINPLSPDYPGSEDWKRLSALGGPAYINLDSQHAAMLQDNNGNVSILFSENEDEQYLVDYQEKLVGIIPCGEREFSLSFSTVCEDGVKVKVEGMIAAVSHPLCVNQGNSHLPPTSPAQNGQPWMPTVDWDEFARESLRSEIKTFLLGHSSMEIRREMGVFGQNAGGQPEMPVSSGKQHSTSEHTPRRFTAGNDLRKNNPVLNLRNRRRSPMPELHSQKVVEEITLIPIPGFQDQLQEYLVRTFKVIYNNAIVQPSIITLGEITFDGIH